MKLKIVNIIVLVGVAVFALGCREAARPFERHVNSPPVNQPPPDRIVAFDVAMKAAADPPVGIHQLNDAEFRAKREVQKEMVREICLAVRSALNNLKADAQARVVEVNDPERAARIRALADPTF